MPSTLQLIQYEPGDCHQIEIILFWSWLSNWYL